MNEVEEIADMILRLNARQIVELQRLLDERGIGGVGVREPRRPRPSLDVTGVALDSEVGKSESEEWPVPEDIR